MAMAVCMIQFYIKYVRICLQIDKYSNSIFDGFYSKLVAVMLTRAQTKEQTIKMFMYTASQQQAALTIAGRFSKFYSTSLTG